jgi:hypothetical protein
MMEDKKTTTQRLQQESDLAIAEFLKNGGVIQKVETGKSGQIPGQETNVWGRRISKETKNTDG